MKFLLNLQWNDCFVILLGEYWAGPGRFLPDVLLFNQRPVLETNTAELMYFFSGSLKSRTSYAPGPYYFLIL